MDVTIVDVDMDGQTFPQLAVWRGASLIPRNGDTIELWCNQDEETHTWEVKQITWVCQYAVCVAVRFVV